MDESWTVGDIIETHRESGEFSFEWRIQDLWLLDDDWCSSPAFSFSNECWCLRLDLNAPTRNSGPNSECMQISLDRDDSDDTDDIDDDTDETYPPKTVHISLAIKVGDGTVKRREDTHLFSKDSSRYCFHEFCLMSDLMNQKSRLEPDDVLTITCALKSEELKILLPKQHASLVCSLKSMLSGGRHSDFTLRAGEGEWRVHKNILESRSEYFAHMFRREEWTENSSGEARFDDVSRDTLDHVLHFIYTGEVGAALTVGSVCDLYVAAHKFLLEDLKPLCVDSIAENMGPDIVCEALTIARIYEEKDLGEIALDYLSQEQDDRIFRMHQWKRFERNNPSIAAEIQREVSDRKQW